MLPAYAQNRAYPAKWLITSSLGGFANVPIGWYAGDTEQEAIATFLEFIDNDESVARLAPEEMPAPGWRQLHVIFQGEHKTLVFRSEWVAGFTIERGLGR